MNANGAGEAMLTNDILSSEDPAWSPDGSQISFGREGRIFVMNADGSGQRVLTNPGAGERDEEARWVTRWSRLAFIRVTSARNLWTINPGGSDHSKTHQPSNTQEMYSPVRSMGIPGRLTGND